MISKHAWAFSLYILIILAFPLTVGAKAIEPEEITRLQVVRDVQISPDGDRIAFTAGKRSDFDQLRESSIWLIPADGSMPPVQLHKSRFEQTTPRWSPDGKSLAFLAAESDDGAMQIWLSHLDGSDPKPITDLKGGVDALKWSRNGQSIAFTATDPPAEDEERRMQAKDDAIHVDHNYKFSRLFILNLSDRTTRAVFKTDASVNDFDWSPDGSRFAIRVSNTPLLDDVYWRSRLLIIHAQTGEIERTLDEHVGSWINLRWSPDGKSIVFNRLSPSSVAELRMIAAGDGSAVRQIDDEYNGTILGMEWMPDSKSLIGISTEGTRAAFVKIPAAGGSVERMARVDAPYSDFTMSADGRVIAFVGEQGDSPANVWIWRPGEAPHRLTNFQPETAGWSLGDVREITWRNRKDQRLIYGVLITPPGFQPDHPYPAVVQIHGGPEWAWWAGWHGSWHEWGQLLASRGYVVLLPNPRGSDGQDWRYVEANIDDWGGLDYEDILSGLDALIKERIIDPDRVGIGGWSYGGFMTAWAITHTDRFKAAVAGAAVTNLFSMSGTGDIPTFLNNYFKDTPFRNRATYEAHSPMSYLPNCRTPALVLHGEKDVRVPISQGQEFYNGLKMLDRTTEMVIYPREDHGFTEEQHQIDLLKRVVDWYDRYL